VFDVLIFKEVVGILSTKIIAKQDQVSRRTKTAKDGLESQD
jgi:hypothetical protein